LSRLIASSCLRLSALCLKHRIGAWNNYACERKVYEDTIAVQGDAPLLRADVGTSTAMWCAANAAYGLLATTAECTKGALNRAGRNDTEGIRAPAGKAQWITSQNLRRPCSRAGVRLGAIQCPANERDSLALRMPFQLSRPPRGADYTTNCIAVVCSRSYSFRSAVVEWLVYPPAARKTRPQFPSEEYFSFAPTVGTQRRICRGMRAEAQRAVLQLLCVLAGPVGKQRKLRKSHHVLEPCCSA
jgi:hypothetical protein